MKTKNAKYQYGGISPTGTPKKKPVVLGSSVGAVKKVSPTPAPKRVIQNVGKVGKAYAKPRVIPKSQSKRWKGSATSSS